MSTREVTQHPDVVRLARFASSLGNIQTSQEFERLPSFRNVKMYMYGNTR
jgi:hypothetical protein